MNIFVVDADPLESARCLVDRHIVKMPLETAQMLITAHWESAGVTSKKLITDELRNKLFVDYPTDRDIYSPTHRNHPCSKWVRESTTNYKWLCVHGLGLCNEYTDRYGKEHKCQAIIEWCYSHIPNIPSIGLTTFASAMDVKYRISDDPITNYRNYYSEGKTHLHDWKILSHKPTWITM